MCDAYSKSKTLAEKCAWDFLNTLPDEEKFEIATVNPGLVLGKAFKKEKFASADVINMFLNRGFPAVPPNDIGMVDV